MAKQKKERTKPRRIQQIRQSYQMTKRSDPKVGQVLLGWFLGVAVVAFLATFFFTTTVFAVVFGILCGVLAALIVFGRRAQRAAITQIEGKPGAAVATLGMLRRGWNVNPQPIAFTKQQDIVSRVVGPPGIVLIGEGNPNRLRPLLASERRKHERVASETPIHEVLVGDGEGQVPLQRLMKHVTKLGREVKPAQMTDILQRIRALDANRSNIPVPKGPLPTSMKGLRQNMRGR
jgi:MFS superfamily sulfate permease-like transporter